MNHNAPVTVRLEYGGMRFENDTVLRSSGYVLQAMCSEHGIGPLKMHRDGTARGVVISTNQRATATLITH